MQANTIFQGISPKANRDAIGNYLKKHKFDKLIIPCVGRFTTPEVAVEAGMAPSQIITGDISLFSSLIGYYLAGKDLTQLGISSAFDFIDPAQPPAEYAASVIYGMKVCQLKENNYYNRELKKAITANPQAQIAALAESLKNLKEKLGGISYDIIDLRELIKNWQDDERALIMVAPPAYGAKGYARMFDLGDKITWNEPNIPYFGNKGDMEALVSGLTGVNATVMLEIFRDRSAVPDTWITYELIADSKLRATYLFLNKEPDESFINRPRFVKTKPLPYPIISPADEITGDSEIKTLIVNLDVANYYRDLFTHKLGASMADTNVIFLIDGKIAAVRGYTSPAQAKGELYEIYGIVHNNTRHRHLNRLIMRLITTRQFERAINNTLFDLEAITSTKISKYPEYREARGILQEYSREELKDGTFKTKYRAAFRDMTFKDCIIEWLKEEESYGQNKQRKPRIRASNRAG